MKTSLIFILFISIVFFACEKDEFKPSNLTYNTFYYDNKSFDVTNAGMYSEINLLKEEYWVIEIMTPRWEDELIFYMVPFDLSSIEGNYTIDLSDKNGDGLVNEMDTKDVGYCRFAELCDNNYVIYFFEGQLNLKKIKGSANEYRLRFEFFDEDSLRMTGNIELEYFD